MKTFKTIWTKPEATVDDWLSMRKFDLDNNLIILFRLIAKGMTITMIAAASCRQLADFFHFLVSSTTIAIVSGHIIVLNVWLLAKCWPQLASNNNHKF